MCSPLISRWSPRFPLLSCGLVNCRPSLEGARVCFELDVSLLVGPEPCSEFGWLSSASTPALQAAAGVVYSAYWGP